MLNRKELQDWQNMWNKAQDEMPKPEPESIPMQEDPIPDSTSEKRDSEWWSGVDKDYWDQIYKGSMGNKSSVLNEESDGLSVKLPQPVKPNQSKEELGDVAKTKANAANPIDPASVGKDQDYKPNLADAHQLEQLHNLKINLYELECKLNANDCLAKTDKGKKIQSQIETLKTQIDELSDTITPDFLQSYLS